jgi:hypothetical protein
MCPPVAGTLYAAKLKQTSNISGGIFDLTWIELGHGSDADLMDPVRQALSRPPILLFFLAPAPYLTCLHKRVPMAQKALAVPVFARKSRLPC